MAKTCSSFYYVYCVCINSCFSNFCVTETIGWLWVSGSFYLKKSLIDDQIMMAVDNGCTVHVISTRKHSHSSLLPGLCGG